MSWCKSTVKGEDATATRVVFVLRHRFQSTFDGLLFQFVALHLSRCRFILCPLSGSRMEGEVCWCILFSWWGMDYANFYWMQMSKAALCYCYRRAALYSSIYFSGGGVIRYFPLTLFIEWQDRLLASPLLEIWPLWHRGANSRFVH